MNATKAYEDAPKWIQFAALAVASANPNWDPGGANATRVRNAAAKAITLAYQAGVAKAGQAAEAAGFCNADALLALALTRLPTARDLLEIEASLATTEPRPALPASSIEEVPAFFFECKECGYDSAEAGWLADAAGDCICPLCAGDSGRDEALRYRPATAEEVAQIKVVKPERKPQP